ncbi:hypothetical protein AA106556_1125 [Neokomagataea tanensis NBRC 106556]|uniref:Uncharacterized protein n=1 Tax=Neokomagataea tanensis NBRC 106556 TaxID=1223519 RepID=A0ABQ0QIZ3_9PROT|nr:hypothetical protein AA106556_1125 [Neokomagataea tanensis NBRC 106556]
MLKAIIPIIAFNFHTKAIAKAPAKAAKAGDAIVVTVTATWEIGREADLLVLIPANATSARDVEAVHWLCMCEAKGQHRGTGYEPDPGE